jgi:hypothetical protein
MFIKLISKIIVKVCESIIKVYQWAYITKMKSQFKKVGDKFSIEIPSSLYGLGYVSVGENFIARRNIKLRAFDTSDYSGFYPELVIGDNFYAGTDCHISSIKRIKIGNNVALASRVTIIDHSHGKSDYSDLEEPVMLRELSTKGEIIIEDNVWIGEGVIVLGGVKIGKNSIIASNAVVTKDVPAYSITGGVPSRIIKSIPHRK